MGYLPSIAAGLIVCGVAVGAASAQPALNSDDIDRISRSVVRVVTLRGGQEVGAGSGTFVDRNGLVYVYTNRHVVEGADDYVVEVLENPNELPVPKYRAVLDSVSMKVDFARLRIDRDDQGRPIPADGLDLPIVSLAAEEARRGDPVFVFGYPGIGDGYLAFTEGTVTTIRNGTMNDRRLPVWYQTDAQVSPGSSGGLAVNMRGEMLGIPTAVRIEALTRLAGILPILAVEATELTKDAPVPAGPDILDPGHTPTYGSAALSSGFTPDPHTVAMMSGGEVNVGYLGGMFALVFQESVPSGISAVGVTYNFGANLVVYVCPPIGALIAAGACAGSTIGSWLGQMTAARQLDAINVMGVSVDRRVIGPVWWGLFLAIVVCIVTFSLAFAGALSAYVAVQGTIDDHTALSFWSTFVQPAVGSRHPDLIHAIVSIVMYGALVAAVTTVRCTANDIRSSTNVAAAVTSGILWSTVIVMLVELLGLIGRVVIF